MIAKEYLYKITLLLFFVILIAGNSFIPVTSEYLPNFNRAIWVLVIISLTFAVCCFRGRIVWAPAILIFVPFFFLWLVQTVFFDRVFPATDSILHLSYFGFAFISALCFASLNSEFSARSVLRVYAQINLVFITIYAVTMILERSGLHLMSILFNGSEGGEMQIFSSKGRSSGFLAQPNQSGCLVVLAVASLLYLIHIRRFNIIAGMAFAFVLSLAVAYTSSRAALLQLASLYVISFAYFIYHKERASLKLCFCLVIATALATFVSGYISDFLINFGQATSLPVLPARVYPELAVDGRLWLFRASIELGLQNPLLGVGQHGYMNGLLSIALQSHDFNQSLVSRPSSLHAHNIFFQIFAIYGLIGLGFLLLICGWILVRVFGAMREGGAEKLYCTVSLAVLFVYSNLEFPLWTFHFLWIFVFFVTPLITSKIETPIWSNLKPLRLGVPALFVLVCILYIPSLHVEYCSILPKKKMASYCDLSDRKITMEAGFLQPYAILANISDRETTIPMPAPEVMSQMRTWRPVPLLMYIDFQSRLFSGDKELAWKKWQEFVHSYALNREFSKSIVRKQLELSGISPAYPEFMEYADSYIKNLKVAN